MTAGEVKPGQLRLREMTSADIPAWNAFVKQHASGSFFHRAEWRRVMERGFGHAAPYLLAEDGKRGIRAVLPLVDVRSRLFGNRLASLPFQPLGGLLAADDAAGNALHARAAEEARSRAVDWLEYRGLRPEHPDMQVIPDRHAIFIRDIPADPDALLKAIPRKRRASVRKGLSNGLQWRMTREIEPFLTLYRRNLHHHGTPAFPRRWFVEILDAFGEDVDILVVSTAEGVPVSAVMSYYHGDNVLPYYAGTHPQARSLHAHDFMYWALMEEARRRGFRRFDFGRSRVGSGAFHYKTLWGFEPTPLTYEYLLVKGRALPAHSPDNPRYRLFIAVWQRLPFAIANQLGPLLVRGLG
ncbi:MAG: FemAB family PEP-CTERM system-associated protein [Alphaproteobacteria bacterium]|nr:MAG: FemAB family PEP-CTERM system-associated protein [Alphaproteobacteria bacterium]